MAAKSRKSKSKSKHANDKPKEPKLKGLDKKATIQEKERFEKLGLQLPPDMEQKLKSLKSKLDKLQDRLLKKFDKYIMGIALIPPPKQATYPNLPPTRQLPKTIQPGIMPQPIQPQEQPNKTHVLVLIDDTDSKSMAKFQLKSKLSLIISQ
ncbi:hypothetical protein KY320_00235, partial [Candidatus Woesearchaeota archaeon]|nr:hypothetical protein [Candidatus Woesearchaeota archaeon]